ncbi:unnamed protein product [Rhizophagus irregularis]|uniref:Uncharacterized protein n=1 Tax=Rhizophagus irregularis TaxID=588596 RepID=A0A2N1NG03_9GLOM|nr:hypothetical protein RhiirC2_776785 [Rhizophagus irregularis]CAB4380425.1 unnamed protein product [Rhizophagus irregularis]CAB5365743.1 unnamed protein product [Rhizophagus irregularis]
MTFCFIIFITFLFPFVSAQLPDDDYSLDAFSGYFDILIGFLVPFLVFIIVDYDYDDEGSKPIAQLARSLIYFLIIGLQQEIAYAFSPDNVSSHVKILQHIVISLLLIGIIGEFILLIKSRGAKTESSSDNEEEEERIESLKRHIRKLLQGFKRTLEQSIKTQIQNLKQTLEENFNIKIQTLEEKFNNKYEILVESINKHFQILVENIENRFQTLVESINKQLENLKEDLEKQIETLKKSIDKQIEALKEKFEKQFKEQTQSLEKLRNEYEQKVKTLEERVKNLEGKEDQSQQRIICQSINKIESRNALMPMQYISSTNAIRSMKHIIEKGESLKMQKMTADLEEKENLIYGERSIHVGNTSTNSKSKTQKMVNKINEFLDFTNFIRLGFLLDYLGLILFIISIGFLLNDLKGSITRSFILTIIITVSITFFFQFMILIIAYSRKNLKRYIKEHQQSYSNIFPKYHAHITIANDLITTNVLYLPSLINYFLLQTPGIFNKIFLNLTALFVSSWIVLTYKTVLNNEGMKEEGGKEPETMDELNEEMEEGKKESDHENV